MKYLNKRIVFDTRPLFYQLLNYAYRKKESERIDLENKRLFGKIQTVSGNVNQSYFEKESTNDDTNTSFVMWPQRAIVMAPRVRFQLTSRGQKGLDGQSLRKNQSQIKGNKKQLLTKNAKKDQRFNFDFRPKMIKANQIERNNCKSSLGKQW